MVHTASQTQTSKVTAATLSPTQLWFAVSELTEGKRGGCSPEERDKELHQIHEVTVLGEGDLRKGGKKKGRAESEICFNKGDFKRRGQHYTLINMQALDWSRPCRSDKRDTNEQER